MRFPNFKRFYTTAFGPEVAVCQGRIPEPGFVPPANEEEDRIRDEGIIAAMAYYETRRYLENKMAEQDRRR